MHKIHYIEVSHPTDVEIFLEKLPSGFSVESIINYCRNGMTKAGNYPQVIINDDFARIFDKRGIQYAKELGYKPFWVIHENTKTGIFSFCAPGSENCTPIGEYIDGIREIEEFIIQMKGG